MPNRGRGKTVRKIAGVSVVVRPQDEEARRAMYHAQAANLTAYGELGHDFRIPLLLIALATAVLFLDSVK